MGAGKQGAGKPGAGKPGADVPPGRRAVIVAGARTPFAKAFGELAQLDTIALAGHAVRGLIEQTGLDPLAIDEVIWGTVVAKSGAPNVAREVVFDLNLPRRIPGVTVSRACLSGLEAITHAARMIERGERDVVIAGGSDSTSNAEVPLPVKLVQALGRLSFGGRLTPKKLWEALREIGSPKELLPKAPKIAERSTGLTMGEHAEDMATKNAISREAQDAFALRSHALAHAAIEAGRMADVVAVPTADGGQLARDAMVRGQIDPGRLASLRPAFAKGGTITAASSSPLTDGGACVLVMSAEKAKALGFPADVAIRDWSYVALDPFDQLLIGPALAVPELCDRHGLAMADIDLFEVHEAFAAQVLSVLDALASEAFCRERLGRASAFGRIPEERLNPNGGSIAIGHPFAATGARIVASAADELRRRAGRRAVVTICAAGAMGGAALLERLD